MLYGAKTLKTANNTIQKFLILAFDKKIPGEKRFSNLTKFTTKIFFLNLNKNVNIHFTWYVGELFEFLNIRMQKLKNYWSEETVDRSFLQL